MSEITKIRCSSLPRLAACPGSLKACEGLESSDSAQSLAGSAGHSSLERYYCKRLLVGSPPIEELITNLDSMTASRCRWYARQIDEIIASHGGAESIITEHEMSIPIACGVDLTGHADLVVICKDGVHLVIDYKFNYLEVPRASMNTQIMGYVVLWDRTTEGHVEATEIHGILAAGGNEDPFTATAYSRESADKAFQRITDIVQSAVLRDVRNPGDDQCKYCAARCSTRCPETLESVYVPPAAIIIRDNLLPANKREAADLRTLAKSYISLAEKYVERIDAEVRAYPEEWAEYFTLQNTGMKTEILSVEDCYRIIVLEENVITHAEFFAGVDFSFTKAADASKDRLSKVGYVKGEVKNTLEDLCFDFIDKKAKQQSVKEVK